MSPASSPDLSEMTIRAPADSPAAIEAACRDRWLQHQASAGIYDEAADAPPRPAAVAAGTARLRPDPRLTGLAFSSWLARCLARRRPGGCVTGWAHGSTVTQVGAGG